MIKIFVCVLMSASLSWAQDVAFAKDLYVHGVKTRALESFIELFHNAKTLPADKAEALYYMGQIAFDENSFSTALDDWQKLIKDYPTSKRALELKDRLIQLQEVFAKAGDASIESLVAQSFIKNGDFWFDKGTKATFSIDSSYLPNLEMAIDWYDRVIHEFPGSNAADLAFQRKLFALFGWKEPGQYGESYGVITSKGFEKYMPTVLKTFEEFEAAFPKEANLQGFRYQIAQVYWSRRDWSSASSWLNKIVAANPGQDTFYTDAAKARLKAGPAPKF